MPERDPDFLIRSLDPLNGGPLPARQVASFITPNELFFVRNHGPVPDVDAATYGLEIHGLVERPMRLSLADLERGFERHQVTTTLACAGQRREELNRVAPIPGELPWGSEAVSTATWSGWRLRDVLARCAPTPEARHVGFEGLDDVERRGERFRYGASIALAKALECDVLLADTMNGQPLPAEHGYPLRVVVPGYIGARQVKWLGSIEARATSSDNYFQAVAYRRYPREMTPDTHDPALGVELTDLEVNCLIAEPADDSRLTAGPVKVRGVAYTGGGARVTAVEVSGDGGSTWVLALLDDASQWTWRMFVAEVEVAFDADGVGEIAARALDSDGGTQPATADGLWNFKGYMNNAWPRVRVVRGD